MKKNEEIIKIKEQIEYNTRMIETILKQLQEKSIDNSNIKEDIKKSIVDQSTKRISDKEQQEKEKYKEIDRAFYKKRWYVIFKNGYESYKVKEVKFK